MGAIYDTERIDDILRCNRVKRAIIIINLIGPPVTLFILLFCSIKIIMAKKQMTILTKYILLIFSSEFVNIISKLIQLLKYLYPDERDDKSIIDIDRPRGIICQIQIVLAIYSDFCSIITTLLISLRCFDVIKNKQRFLDKGKRELYSIIITIFISIIFAISFLFFDRFRTKTNRSYRFDFRDRCSYWCWLEHLSSIICFVIYIFLIIIISIVTFKTNSYLKLGFKKLLKENDINIHEINNNKNDSMNSPLIDLSKENSNSNSNSNSKNDSYEINKKKINSLSKEEKKRIDELRLMRRKCFVYPMVTIIIWSIIGTYRIADDSFMWGFDNGDDAEQSVNDEKDFFEQYQVVQFFTQFFLVLHTILSSFRGIFYGFSFIIFEEKLFFNFFRKFCIKSLFKDENLDEDDEEEEEGKKDIVSTSTISDSVKDEDNEKKDSESKTDTVEMNNSDYRYNEND